MFQHFQALQHFSYLSCLLSFSAHIHTFFQSQGESYMQSERPLVQIKRNCKMKGNKNRVSGRTNSLHLLCHTLPLLLLTKFPYKLPLLVGTFQKCKTLVCSNQSLLLCMAAPRADQQDARSSCIFHPAVADSHMWLVQRKYSHMVISLFSKLHHEQLNLVKLIFIASCGENGGRNSPSSSNELSDYFPTFLSR